MMKIESVTTLNMGNSMQNLGLMGGAMAPMDKTLYTVAAPSHRLTPLSSDELALIAAYTITPTIGKKSWLTVTDNSGVVVGYVTRRHDGEFYRTHDGEGWEIASWGYYENEPIGGRGVLSLAKA